VQLQMSSMRVTDFPSKFQTSSSMHVMDALGRRRFYPLSPEAILCNHVLH
jgi:hypothetical protein